MGKRIMTVDDSKTVRKVLNITLTQAGYEVIEAIDGKEALSLFSVNNIDLLVTDLNMPNLDGVDLIKQVRKKPGNRFMPIIMLTSESQLDKKQEGKKAGASGWVTKPFKPEQLLSIVRTVCPAT
jgi:two-component system chemotaxis response regulator CheY